MPVSIHDVLPFQIHAQIVLSQSPQDYAPLFGELADAYFERGLYAEAKPVYEVLGSDVGVSARSFLYLHRW
jgi:general transcription factor 3C polypeptide 3 (transcription factor C subunit 4)